MMCDANEDWFGGCRCARWKSHASIPSVVRVYTLFAPYILNVISPLSLPFLTSPIAFSCLRTFVSAGVDPFVLAHVYAHMHSYHYLQSHSSCFDEVAVCSASNHGTIEMHRIIEILLRKELAICSRRELCFVLLLFVKSRPCMTWS